MADDSNKTSGADIERELEAERQRSAELAARLEQIQSGMDDMREQLKAELDATKARFEQAEQKLLEQSTRLQTLGNGREETMRQLQETRAELKRVVRERDELQKRVATISDMQTETLTLPDDADPTQDSDGLPSIDDLMASLSDALEEKGDQPDTLGTSPVETPDEDWQEMLAPELILPEEFSAKKGSDDDDDGSPLNAARILVLADAEQPIKYPLFKETMTIGRSESADIQIEGDFISRIHTRIVTSGDEVIVEDAGSKNGTKVNSKLADRQVLKHGDTVSVGRRRFTFVDLNSED